MKLELKVCEACGGLWLRPQGLRWKYCAKCAQKMRELPQREARATNPRLPRRRSTDNREPITDNRNREVLA